MRFLGRPAQADNDREVHSLCTLARITYTKKRHPKQQLSNDETEDAREEEEREEEVLATNELQRHVEMQSLCSPLSPSPLLPHFPWP